MKKVLLIFAAAALALGFRAAEPFEGEPVKESGTTYVHDALEPYVKSGELPGAISILYKDGVQETLSLIHI